jgi:hypothetical protein
VGRYIKLDFGEIEWSGMDWIGVAQDKDKWRALVDVVMTFLGFIKCWEIILWLHN